MPKMKSMTIHGLDDQLARLIKSKAESEGLSINKTIKNLLETSLGIKPEPPRKNIKEFKEFCGIWNREDLRAFDEATSDTRIIDPEDWQ
jgi:hypothetical protein